MVGVVVFFVLVVGFFIGYLVWKTSEPPELPEVDPEQAMKAAVELHRIRRNLDVAWTKTEQRREGARLRREIAKTLEDDERAA